MLLGFRMRSIQRCALLSGGTPGYLGLGTKPMRRPPPFLVPFLMLLSTHGWAQPADRAWVPWKAEKSNVLRFDTTYVHSHRRALSIGYVTTLQNAVISVRDTLGMRLDHSTNNPSQYGLGLSIGWLSGEVTFTVPGVSVADPLKGTTRSRNYGVGITARRFIARAFFNGSEGFFPEQPALVDSTWTTNSPYPARGDIRSNTFLASVNYALSSKRRFSFKAALLQTERQRRSAGTFLAGGTLWMNDIRSGSPFIPATASAAFLGNTSFDRVGRTVIGATIGYTHTLVILRKGFITGALVPGLSIQQQDIGLTDGTERLGDWHVGGVVESKLGMGYNGDRIYVAFNGASYFSSADTGEGLNVLTGFRFVRFTLGLRFPPPSWNALRSLGLTA